MCEGNVEYLNITKISSEKKYVLEKLLELSYCLYYTSLKKNETYMVVERKFTNHNNFIIWHDWLGHPGSVMMQKIINSWYWHKLKNKKILQSNDFPCIACSHGKLIVRSSRLKLDMSQSLFWSAYKEIYVDQFIHQVDHLDILWF